MRNRIIAIVLVVALIPCCLAVNASAAGEKDTIVNLMSENGEYASNPINVVDGGYWVNNSSLIWAENAISGELVWNAPSLENFESVYFSFYSSTPPQNVTFINDGTAFSTQLVSVNDKLYTYKAILNTILGQICLRFEFNGAFIGYINLISAYGVYSDAYLLNNVDLENQALLYEADDDKLYRYVVDKQVGSLPISTQHLTNYVNEPTDPLMEGLLFTHIVTDQIPFDYADSITFVFRSSGSVKEAGLSLLSKSGSYVGQLEVDLVEYSYMKGVDFHFPNGTDMEWPWYHYSSTVDLSGYDLSELNLSFFCSVDPVYLDEYEGYTGYSFSLSSVVLYPTIEDVPWYARFGKWITGGFNSVVSGLTSGFNSVVNAISSVFNPDGSNELSQAGEDLSQSAGDIDSAGDVLGSVDQPDVNSGDLIGGFTNFDSGGLKVLSCLTSNAQVTQMMIVVFTFSLAGYIFFGKKG